MDTNTNTPTTTNYNTITKPTDDANDTMIELINHINNTKTNTIATTKYDTKTTNTLHTGTSSKDNAITRKMSNDTNMAQQLTNTHTIGIINKHTDNNTSTNTNTLTTPHTTIICNTTGNDTTQTMNKNNDTMTPHIHMYTRIRIPRISRRIILCIIRLRVHIS